GAHLVDRDAGLPGRQNADRDARAGDIGGAEDQRPRAVDRDVEGAGGLAAAVEPEPGGDAAALAGRHRRIVVVALLGSLKRLDEADAAEGLAVDRLIALGRRVLEPQIDRVHAELPGELVDHALAAEDDLRRARGAERIHLRAVRHDLVGRGLHVLEVVAGEHRLRRVREHRAGEGAGLEDELGLRRRDGAVLLDAHLDAGPGAGDRAGGAEDVVAGEGDLDRAPRLAGQLDRHRLAVEAGLAAEAAAHLRLLHADLRGLDLEDVGEPVAEHPRTLRAAPQLDLAIFRGRGDAALRLDIALVHRLGVVFALDDDVSFRKTLLHVANAEIESLDHVRGLVGALDAFGANMIVQDR